jgi:hypothetical protein
MKPETPWIGLFGLGALLTLAACDKTTGPASGNGSLIGGWESVYKTSGTTGGCSRSACRPVPYTQRDEFEYRFSEGGIATREYRYYRNNDGDTSESYRESDSLRWSSRNDSLFLTLTGYNTDGGGWRMIDTVENLIQIRVAYSYGDGILTLKQYPLPDSGGSIPVNLALTAIP